MEILKTEQMSGTSSASRPLSVVMLTASFFPYVGGAEKQALELSRFLASNGVRTLVLTRRLPGTSSEEEIKGIRVKRLFAAGSGVLNSVSFMLSSLFYLLVHSREYEIIHVHLASSPALTACLIGRLLGKKVVVKLGGGRGLGEISLSRKTFPGRLKLRLLSFFGPRVLAVNTDLIDELKESGLGKIPATLFKNGVDTATYSPVSYHEKLAAKERLGVPKRTLFLFVGRLVPEKRLKEFLEVWSEITRNEGPGREAGLLIVGGGPEKGSLEEASRALGLEETVRFEGEKEDLLPYYRAADVFILPSVSEGLSNSMLEAMSCGLAIMASRVGGSRAAVAEGKNGFLFDPFDRQELSQTAVRFFRDKSLAVRLGEESRRMAVNNYSMQKVIKELLEIYKGG